MKRKKPYKKRPYKKHKEGKRKSPLGKKQSQKFLKIKAIETRKYIKDYIEDNLKEKETDKKISLDEWQKKSLSVLLDGKNLIVDAPTTAGKTKVIEIFLDETIPKGKKLIYTSPVKSLSNDKYRDFCARYGKDLVGINTGDFKENLDAPIILATLETYRNSLLGIEPRMERATIVYDEYHYLQDFGRGSAWEESIILTPSSAQIVMLSASVPNSEEFKKWLESLTTRECDVVTVTKRPVPLENLIFTPQGFITEEKLELTEKETKGLKRNFRDRNRRDLLKIKGNYSELLKPCIEAINLKLHPVIIYAGRRMDVENIIRFLSTRLEVPQDNDTSLALKKRISTLLGWSFIPRDLQRLILQKQISYHHSGLTPPAKVAIETLLKEGYLKICSGTMGLSLGVNFSVRSALVFDYSRPDERGFVSYSSVEMMQMLGRAGRRGIDKKGFSLWLDLEHFAAFKPERRSHCKSSLRFDPTTILGILGQNPSYDYLSTFYKKSFFLKDNNEYLADFFDHSYFFNVLKTTYKIKRTPCSDIINAYEKFNHNQKTPCRKCNIRRRCHGLLKSFRYQPLQKVVRHLERLRAIEKEELTKYGELCRYFPQNGGLLISHWIISGTFNKIDDLFAAAACFCSAHHKDIPQQFLDPDLFKNIIIKEEFDKFYPSTLFPDLYEKNPRFFRGKRFREWNPGAASVATMWMDPKVTWDELLDYHVTGNFSEGDIMMLLFRFATLLQSFMRVKDLYPDIAESALKIRDIILRAPLDAKNTIYIEEEKKLH